METHTHTHVRTHIHARTQTHTLTHAHTYTHTCKGTNTHINSHTCNHTNRHSETHAHTHTMHGGLRLLEQQVKRERNDVFNFFCYCFNSSVEGFKQLLNVESTLHLSQPNPPYPHTRARDRHRHTHTCARTHRDTRFVCCERTKSYTHAPFESKTQRQMCRLTQHTHTYTHTHSHTNKPKHTQMITVLAILLVDCKLLVSCRPANPP